ncbi:MAG: DUF2007 domain-containing protein [Nitrospirae bacterium]|nr:DUF2007 domain-containing protein [Nitrospirota bacterium]
MFCPGCKTEYREGFSVCADCNIGLVDELPSEPFSEYVEYEEIMVTYNPADVAIIKSILDAEEITYFFHGENFMHVRPLVEPARLMVDKEEAQDARELLRDLNLSIMGINLGQDDDKD